MVRRWRSEEQSSWGIPVEGFQNHVTTDGSLLGVSGKWGACGWSVVQLDHDEEMGPMGCTERWMQSLRCSVPSKELS